MQSDENYPDYQDQFHKSTLKNRYVQVKALGSENTLVERFAELYGDSESADVTILCGRNRDVLKAHRFILSCGSVYFRDALKVTVCRHPLVLLTNISGDLMGRILEYIYLGQVKLKSESEYKQFLKAAKYLMVAGIQDDQYFSTN